MARLDGDNGKPDDTAVGKILSPYTSDQPSTNRLKLPPISRCRCSSAAAFSRAQDTAGRLAGT